jgi:hypothetical protein
MLMREQQARFAAGNLAAGAVVSAILVLLAGYGLVAVAGDLLAGTGPDIVGALLFRLSIPSAVMLGAAFTARRARRRNSRPMPEGVAAGLAGLTPLVIVAWHDLLAAAGNGLFVIVGLAVVLLPSAAAALVGARLGGHGLFTSRGPGDRS